MNFRRIIYTLLILVISSLSCASPHHERIETCSFDELERIGKELTDAIIRQDIEKNQFLSCRYCDP